METIIRTEVGIHLRSEREPGQCAGQFVDSVGIPWRALVMSFDSCRFPYSATRFFGMWLVGTIDDRACTPVHGPACEVAS